MSMRKKYYNFSHTISQIAPVSKKVVLWNFLDFGHVNFVHKRCYSYCKVLAKQGNVTFLEYGANQLLNRFIPLTLRHIMWHQFIPPDTVTHVSRSPFGTYTKVIVKITEVMKDGKAHTKIHHQFFMRLPSFLLPFSWLVTRYLERWSALLWEEDLGMCLRRQKAMDLGFQDAPLDTLPIAPEGLLLSEIAEKNKQN